MQQSELMAKVKTPVKVSLQFLADEILDNKI